MAVINKKCFWTAFTSQHFQTCVFWGVLIRQIRQERITTTGFQWLNTTKKGSKPLSYLSSNFLQFINATSVFNHECCAFPACSRSLRLLQLGCLDFEILLSKVTLYARNKHYCFTVIIVSVTVNLLFVEEKKTFQSGGANVFWRPATLVYVDWTEDILYNTCKQKRWQIVSRYTTTHFSSLMYP